MQLYICMHVFIYQFQNRPAHELSSDLSICGSQVLGSQVYLLPYPLTPSHFLIIYLCFVTWSHCIVPAGLEFSLLCYRSCWYVLSCLAYE